MYKISDKEFSAKTAITAYVRTILHGVNKELSKDSNDFKFLMELFKNHPDYDLKIKDKLIDKIIIDKDIHYGTTKCFFIIYDNERRSDISFTWCIQNLISTKDYNEELILNFGKYKGQSIYDIPVEYIEWCVKDSMVSKSIKTKMNRFLTYGKI